MVISHYAYITVVAVKTFTRNIETTSSAKTTFLNKYIVRPVPFLTSFLPGCAIPGSLKATKRYERHYPRHTIIVRILGHSCSTLWLIQLIMR